MFLANTTAIIGASIGIGSAIIGVYIWVSKHITNSNRHPECEKIVFKDLCQEKQNTNKAEHQHLKEGIEAAIKRSDEQHHELKKSVEKGFDNVIDFMKNNKN